MVDLHISDFGNEVPLRGISISEFYYFYDLDFMYYLSLSLFLFQKLKLLSLFLNPKSKFRNN